MPRGSTVAKSNLRACSAEIPLDAFEANDRREITRRRRHYVTIPKRSADESGSRCSTFAQPSALGNGMWPTKPIEIQALRGPSLESWMNTLG